MTIAYGLTPTGFVVKPLNVIRAEINAALQAAFGPSIDLGDQSILGQFVGIFAEREALSWQRAAQCYSAADPNAATGSMLDALCALTGTVRPQATPSVVTITATGTPTTIVVSGSQVKTTSTGALFATSASGTIAALSAWTTNTAYSVGARVTSSGNAYQCTIAGTSSNGAGPSSTSYTPFADNTVTWQFLGVGTGAVDISATAVNTGPTTAVAGDIAGTSASGTIVTPIVGWNGVFNMVGAALGTSLMADGALRQLRVLELAGDGAATLPAIIAHILALTTTPAITTCTVFENVTDLTDSGGRPPHSVEALIQGGANQDIWNALLANVAAGINTFGNTTGAAVDAQGISHTVSFSRPVAINVYIDITLTFNPATGAYAGDASVQNAINTYGANAAIDLDVFASQIASVALSVAGVLDVNPVRIYTDVIGTPTAWAPTTGYVATPGARSVVTNDGGRTYICVAGGTSAGSGGPTGTGTAIVDGGATWYFLGNTVNITDHQVMNIVAVTVHSSAAAGI